MKVSYKMSLIFLNNPKDLDLSYKTDLDFLNCFGRKKKLSYDIQTKHCSAVGISADIFMKHFPLRQKGMYNSKVKAPVETCGGV